MPSEFLRLKTEIPALGIGLGLRGEICQGILENRNSIDFLEFTPENFRDNNASIGWLSGFAEYFPFVSHSVSLSIGSVDPLDTTLLKMTRSFIKRFGLKFWSDHLCFIGVDGESGNDLFPLPWTDEAVKHVAKRVRQAQEIVEYPLLLENIPFYTHMPRGDFDEAEFIARTLEEADCGMLLDLNNLLVNSINHKFDPRKFLDRLPLERVVQIHLAGHGKFGQRLIDTHGAAVSEPVFELLDYVLLQNIDPKAVMIERDQYFPQFDELLNEVNHARSIWNKHCASVKSGPAKEEHLTASGIISATMPPPAVAELAAIPVQDSSEENEYIKSDSASNPAKPGETDFLSINAIDQNIRLNNLAQYERTWFDLWRELKGISPYDIDSTSFKPKFAHNPVAIDGFDLKAISIYTWLRDSNRDSLMRNVFPACFNLLRSQWQNLLEKFFYDFRPQYKDNRHVGDRFPEFLKLHGIHLLPAFPFLFELAEFEQLKNAAGKKHEFTDFSGDVYLGSTEQIKQCRPLVNPELSIKSFIYPVVELASRYAGNTSPSQSSDDVDGALHNPVILAFLPQSWSSKVVELSGAGVKLIDLARKGNLTYSQMIASEMSEAQRQSPEEIANFIRLFQLLHNEKIFIGCIPVEHKEQSWSSYGKMVAQQEPHQTILLALQNFNKTGHTAGQAIDLGCGPGRDAKFMLSQGWHVFAVDKCDDSLELLRNSSNGWQPELLSTYQGNMEDAPLPKADLVNAGISLPFCPPDKFEQLWQNLRDSLSPGGRFSGHFFGKNDDWAVSKTMTFFAADQIKQLFAGFEFEWYNEFEGQIPLVPSGFRHGHIFEIVARKL